MRKRDWLGFGEIADEDSDGVVALAVNMDDRGGSFVAVRRISQGLERGNTCQTTSGNFFFFFHFWLYQFPSF